MADVLGDAAEKDLEEVLFHFIERRALSLLDHEAADSGELYLDSLAARAGLALEALQRVVATERFSAFDFVPSPDDG